MAKLQYIGQGHHRIITEDDLTKHGLTGVNIDVWRGDIAEVPNDVAEWLLGEFSLEAREWRLCDPGEVTTLGSTPRTTPEAPVGAPMVEGLNPDNTNPGEPETEANEGAKKKK